MPGTRPGNDARRPHRMAPMQALVTGATGKVGHAIASALLDRGDGRCGRWSAIRSVRRASCRPASSRCAATSPTRAAWPPRSRAASSSSTRWGCRSSGCATRRSSTGSMRSAAQSWRSPRSDAGVRRFVHTSTHDVFHADTASASTRRCSPTIRRGPPTSVPSSTPRNWCWPSATAWRWWSSIPPASTARPRRPPRPSRTGSSSRWCGSGCRLCRRAAPATPSSRASPPGICSRPRRGPTASATSSPTATRASARSPRPSARSPAVAASRRRCPSRSPRRSPSIGAGVSRVIRRPPLLPKGQLTYFLWQARPDSSKAQRELGWRTTPLDEGVRQTLNAMGLLEGS